MKRFLSVLLLMAFLLASAGSLPAAAAPGGSVKYQSREITAYLYAKDKTTTMTCLFRDDLPAVPYISAVDYLNQLYTVEFSCKKNQDGTFTVSDANGEMVVDIDKDKIYFEDFVTFVDTDSLPILETETADYLLGEEDYEVIGEVRTTELDLAAYGIDLTASGSDVYFPLPLINDLFSGTYHAALYLDGALYFAEVMADEPYYDDSSLFDSVTRDKALVEYTYNELCFVMDHLYGFPTKSKLAQTIKEKGFDKAISEYNATTAEAKRLLLSDSLTDYCYGLLYLDMYMDDGGHTVMSYGLQVGLDQYDKSAFSTALVESLNDYSNSKLMTIWQYIMDQSTMQNDRENLSDLRDGFFEQMTEVKTWEDAALYQSGNTVFFTFDEFKDAVVEPFKWSLDYAAEHGIGSFVIDLSLNGGGATAVAVYILSVLCDYTRFDIFNTLTGNQYYVNETVDKNLDGEFDDKDDEVKYDLQFAVLTSKFSFSAANLLACLLKYNGVCVVGENSGGGTCAITMHSDPAGYAYAISDLTKMVYPDGKDVDQGAALDVEMPGANQSYYGYYNLNRINEGVGAFYAGTPVPERPTDPTEPGGNDPVIYGKPLLKEYEKAAPFLWAVSGAVALCCLIAFIVILIRSAKKKNRY